MMSTQLSKGEASGGRTFLAVDLPDSLKSELGTLQPFLSGSAPLKWSAPGLLHITVRFLGNVPAHRLRDVEDAALAGAGSVAPFDLHLEGLGAFPNERSPRVLWVGLAHDGGYEDLRRLFARTEDALASRGFGREERAFAPHITLARTRDRASAAEKRALGDALRDLKERADIRGTWHVDALIVTSSDLSRSGPTYSALAVCPLAAGYH